MSGIIHYIDYKQLRESCHISYTQKDQLRLLQSNKAIELGKLETNQDIVN